MLNMQHKNLMIPPESEPTLFAAAFKMSRIQFPMIWDADWREGQGRTLLNKEHKQGTKKVTATLRRLNYVADKI